MLRGERILQLSCGHVAHEACFYEYIKEFEAESCPDCQLPLAITTTRGGTLDFENLNKLARHVQTPDLREPRDPDSLPSPYDAETLAQPALTSQQIPSPPRPSRDHLLPEQVQASIHHYERNTASRLSHNRNTSGETGMTSRNGISDMQDSTSHRRELDRSDTSVQDPWHMAKSSIPAPTITVRSEFPTINKSRQQQSLTCLVTVEVVEPRFQPIAEELQSPLSAASSARQDQSGPFTLNDSRRSDNRRLVDSVHEETALEEAREQLMSRVDDWHGLDVARFGKLILHGVVKVGKDRQTWQELECYLFSDMLICVKDKKVSANSSQQWQDEEGPKPKTKYTIKGSILIRRHLREVETLPDNDTLTLHLSVVELPAFHLRFKDSQQLEGWRKALSNINRLDFPTPRRSHQDNRRSFKEGDLGAKQARRVSSVPSSSNAGTRSHESNPTRDVRLGAAHVPIDVVVVIPVSASMTGLKMNLLRDSLKFLVSIMGEKDRMGLVCFGSAGAGIPLIDLTRKDWRGWSEVLDSLRAVEHKNPRADVAEAANVAMDMLMQRRSINPLSHIILISDSSTSDPESVDFVVSRAEAAKTCIYSLGLGLTHKPDAMVEMATRTKASYTYVKDWMMLRECLAGCVGSIQSTSHQNAKLRLRLPEGSPAKFIKISGALQVTKRASGRDAEASLGDLRFGDKRDILVQLAIQADSSVPDPTPADPWESIISGLEAMDTIEEDDIRPSSVEELPLLQADLSWGDITRDGKMSQLARPSLLAITMLPAPPKQASYRRPPTPPIPPHPSVVQRRMELLTSDMLSRALILVSRGHHDRAQHLLSETRSILKGLGKGSLPPLPTPPPTAALPPTPKVGESKGISIDSAFPPPPSGRRTPSPVSGYNNELKSPFSSTSGIDRATLTALDSELGSSLEYISHPAVFSRDSRKAILQAIGVISSQRGLTFRTLSETLYATRIHGVRRLADRSREWRDTDDALTEES